METSATRAEVFLPTKSSGHQRTTDSRSARPLTYLRTLIEWRAWGVLVPPDLVSFYLAAVVAALIIGVAWSQLPAGAGGGGLFWSGLGLVAGTGFIATAEALRRHLGGGHADHLRRLGLSWSGIRRLAVVWAAPAGLVWGGAAAVVALGRGPGVAITAGSGVAVVSVIGAAVQVGNPLVWSAGGRRSRDGRRQRAGQVMRPPRLPWPRRRLLAYAAKDLVTGSLSAIIAEVIVLMVTAVLMVALVHQSAGPVVWLVAISVTAFFTAQLLCLGEAATVARRDRRRFQLGWLRLAYWKLAVIGLVLALEVVICLLISWVRGGFYPADLLVGGMAWVWGALIGAACLLHFIWRVDRGGELDDLFMLISAMVVLLIPPAILLAGGWAAILLARTRSSRPCW